MYKVLQRTCTVIVLLITTIFVDTRLWKTKHPRKHFQTFHKSWPSDLLYVMLAGCDWWISIRSFDNRQDWRKFWKRFRGCFVFQSHVSTKMVVNLLFSDVPVAVVVFLNSLLIDERLIALALSRFVNTCDRAWSQVIGLLAFLSDKVFRRHLNTPDPKRKKKNKQTNKPKQKRLKRG